MRIARHVHLAGIALIACMLSPGAPAFPGGVTGSSVSGCGPCHSSGPAGTTITVVGPTTVAPASVSQYTVSVPAGSGGGGLDVTVTAGTLVAGSGTQLAGSEITHAVSARTYTFTWTAPLANGTVTMNVAAMAANGDGEVDGDGWDVRAVRITVAGAPPPDGDGDGTPDSADCGPSNPAVHPGAPENCVNGLDDDCDGAIDGADSACGALAHVVMLGDVAPRGALDGQITIADVVLVLRFITGLDVMTAAERVASDVAPGSVTLPAANPPVFTASPDGLVNIGDAVVILRAAVDLVAINPPLPYQGENNLISFHANAWLQDEADCMRCHGTMMAQEHSTPATPAFHPRHLPLLPAYRCTTCHPSVDLLEGSGTSLRKQADVRICVTCHAAGGPGSAAGFRLYLR